MARYCDKKTSPLFFFIFEKMSSTEKVTNRYV